jgi:hypothetical protein
MAYKFPKLKDYSIAQAQKRLELSDNELEQCLENRWLRLALPKAVISGMTDGHFAALPVGQEESMPAEDQDLIAALCPLPDYLYYAGEHVPTGAVAFDDFLQNGFLLAKVRRYTTTTVIGDTEVRSPFSGHGEFDPNAKTKIQVDPATPWHLAQTMCGEEYGFDPDDVIQSHMVVPEEEMERFTNEYGLDVPRKTVTLVPIINYEEVADDMKPHQKATATRTKEKERRQAAVRTSMDSSNLELSDKEWAKRIHEIISRDPSKYGMKKAPAVSTIQNDITEIKKRRS